MSRYLITGATGYIGSMLSKKLIGQKQDVTVLIRDSKRLDPEITSAAEMILADLTDREAVSGISERYDYLIHCAAPTDSAYMISNPVEVTDVIVNGTKNMLELAGQCSVKSMIYLSSMEVYGQIDCQNGKRVKEDELGYLDLTQVRSCYPVSKRMAENLCHCYYQEFEIPVKIVRLAQTFGRGVRSQDRRVFAQFARSVKTGTDIVLHTRGNSMGNYCDIDDAVAAILFLLENGEHSQCYNVVNEMNTMTIREMAELVAKRIAGGTIRVTYDIPEGNSYGYAADTGLRLSGEKLRKLGWEATCSLEDMFRKMLG